MKHSAPSLPSLEGLVQASVDLVPREKPLPQLSRMLCISGKSCRSQSYLLQRNEHFLITIHICWKGREVCGLVIAVNVKILQSSLYYNHHSQSFSAQKGNKTFFIGSYCTFNIFLLTHTPQMSLSSLQPDTNPNRREKIKFKNKQKQNQRGWSSLRLKPGHRCIHASSITCIQICLQFILNSKEVKLQDTMHFCSWAVTFVARSSNKKV